jgi:hypothetical protein
MAESRHGRHPGIRALALYGLSLLALLDVHRAMINSASSDSAKATSALTVRNLSGELNRVYNELTKEVRDGYPQSEAVLLSHTVFSSTEPLDGN